MKSLRDIQQQLAEGRFEFSRHAFRRVIERNISEQEIRDAGAEAEVIEHYPDDKYSPSALLLGKRGTVTSFIHVVESILAYLEDPEFSSVFIEADV